MKIQLVMLQLLYILQKEFITLFLAEEMNTPNIKAVSHMESTSLNIAKSMISIDIITMLMTIGTLQFRLWSASLEKPWVSIQIQSF
jgi:hypothetical protein